MSNEQRNRSGFCTCLQYSRTWFIPALLILILASSGHGIECYSNDKRKNQLRTKDGKDDLVTCESSSECYETVLTAARDTFATYTAGCSPCETDDDSTTCYSCKAPLCNNHHAKEIRKKNFQCFTDGDKNTFGSKTIYCFKGIKECYYEEVTTASNKVHYVAGCGTAPAACPKEYCKICKQNLCNFPDSMRAVVFKRHKTTKDDKKKEGQEADADAEKANKAGGVKKACKPKVKGDNKGGGKTGKKDNGGKGDKNKKDKNKKEDKEDKEDTEDKEDKDDSDEECEDEKGDTAKDKKDKEEANDLESVSVTPTASFPVVILSVLVSLCLLTTSSNMGNE